MLSFLAVAAVGVAVPFSVEAAGRKPVRKASTPAVATRPTRVSAAPSSAAPLASAANKSTDAEPVANEAPSPPSQPVAVASSDEAASDKTVSPATDVSADTAASSAEDDAPAPSISYPTVSGTKAGNISLAGGGQYVFTPTKGIPSLVGQTELQVTDFLALRASGTIPLTAGPDEARVFAGQGGATFHFRSRAVFDPYIGVGGGLALIDSSKYKVEAAPFINLSGGLRIYFTNTLFFQLEGGYQFLTYAAADHYTDLNAPFAQAQGGMVVF